MVVRCIHCGFTFGMDPDGKFAKLVWMCNRCGYLNNADRQRETLEEQRRKMESSRIVY